MAKTCNNAVQPPTGVVRFFKVKHDVTPAPGEKNPQRFIHQQCSNCKEYREIKIGFQKHHRNKANSICNDCTYAIECVSCNQFKHRYVHYSVAQRALKSLGQSECHQCVAYKNTLIEWETRRDQGVAPAELGPRPEPGGTEFDEMEASKWDQSLLEEITVSTVPESWSYSDDDDDDY